MKSLRIMLAAFAATAAITACAADSQLRETHKLALYRAHAGAPVNSFHYFGSLNSWTPLGDRAVAVWTRPHEAYLLEIDGPCPDLDFAQAIGLTTQAGSVYARFDKVIPRQMGGGAPPIPCIIREIRPLDEKALKAAEHDARAKARADG